MLPHQGGGGDEDDGYDETIIPLDSHQSGPIGDDDLFHVLVSPMAASVTMMCLMDSCHSGIVLDLPYHFTATGSRLLSAVPFTRMENQPFFSHHTFELPPQMISLIRLPLALGGWPWT
jgi:Caspase domain